MSNPIPNTSSPIIANGGTLDPQQAPKELGPLRGLVGNWNNPNPTQPGPQKGYNVMPLPQAGAPNDNVILKDFHYYEEMTFSAIPGDAANRGGTIQQNCWVLFYEQRVYFGSDAGAQENGLVHAENGDWLYLIDVQQGTGASDSGQGTNPSGPQPEFPVVKQVSVPHGNSILAPGKVTTHPGGPKIGQVNTTPTGSGVTPQLLALYNDGNYDPNNPMLNPNIVLWQALEGINVLNTTTFTLSTANPGGGVANIPFEHSRANVSAFHTTFWLLELEDNKKMLQYSQTIEMEFQRNPNVTFYHIDAASMTPPGQSPLASTS